MEPFDLGHREAAIRTALLDLGAALTFYPESDSANVTTWAEEVLSLHPIPDRKRWDSSPGSCARQRPPRRGQSRLLRQPIQPRPWSPTRYRRGRRRRGNQPAAQIS